MLPKARSDKGKVPFKIRILVLLYENKCMIERYITEVKASNIGQFVPKGSSINSKLSIVFIGKNNPKLKRMIGLLKN
jgi:hypothetical protein